MHRLRVETLSFLKFGLKPVSEAWLQEGRREGLLLWVMGLSHFYHESYKSAARMTHLISMLTWNFFLSTSELT